MRPLFGRRSRPCVPDSDEPVGIIADPASVQLIRLRHLVDDLTGAALRARRDCDLAIDLRRALNLPMPRPVPVVPGYGGEGGA